MRKKYQQIMVGSAICWNTYKTFQINYTFEISDGWFYVNSEIHSIRFICEFTDLGRLFCNFHTVNHTQCKNVLIFLPFRFHLLSFLDNLEGLKLPFFAILRALDCVLLVNFSFQKVQNSWKSIHEPLNVVKWQNLRL